MLGQHPYIRRFIIRAVAVRWCVGTLLIHRVRDTDRDACIGTETARRHSWQHRSLSNAKVRVCPWTDRGRCSTMRDPRDASGTSQRHSVAAIYSVGMQKGVAKERARACAENWQEAHADVTRVQRTMVTAGCARQGITLRSMVSPCSCLRRSCSSCSRRNHWGCS